MPDWIYRIGGTGTTLSQDQQDNNILCIYDALNRYGWTKTAIAGACGCFQQESSYNPGIYETSHGGNLNNLPYFPGGMGMGQWTDYPAYTAQYPNPLPWSADKEHKNWYDGDFQCWLLTQADNADYTSMGYGQGPRWGWQTSISYPSISFNDYIHFDGIVDDAVKYWFFCFEWHSAGIPDWVDYEERVRQGRHALEVMGGYTPGGTIDAKELITILAKKRGERSGRIRRTILL